MKFADPNDAVAVARDEACLRKFLAGNKTAFAQAFWENGRRNAGGLQVSAPCDEPESAEGNN